MKETTQKDNKPEPPPHTVKRFMIIRKGGNGGALYVYGKNCFACWAADLSAFEILEHGFKNKANATILLNKTTDKQNLNIKKFIIQIDPTIQNYK